MLVFVLFESEGLLRGKGHDRRPDTVVDAVVDDAGDFADEVELMPFGDDEEGAAQEIVFRHEFAHIQALADALHPVPRLAARVLYGRRGDVARQGEITDDLVHNVRHMVGERGPIELQFAKELASSEQPLIDNLLPAVSKDFGQLLDAAMLIGHCARSLAWLSPESQRGLRFSKQLQSHSKFSLMTPARSVSRWSAWYR